MARILHAADLHLDTQPSELRRYPELVGDVLRDASLRAFDNLVDHAVSEKVSACLFAGDIYDGAERGVRAQLRFRDGLERLSENGIVSFLAYGNHDPVDEGWSAIHAWPEHVTSFDTGEPQVHQLETDGGAVAVHGVSYATRRTTENLARRFSRRGSAPVQIAMLHANVGHQPGHEAYAPCSLEDLRASGVDYWALGHVHTRQVLAGPDPWVAYPGNLQGRNPKPSERGAKGALVIDFQDGSVTGPPVFASLDVVRFVAVDLDISELGDVGELADALGEQAAAWRTEHQGRSLVARARLTGRSELRSSLMRPGALEELRGELQRVDGMPFLWWDRIENHTLPEADLSEAAASDDLVGHVLRRLDPAVPTTASLDLVSEGSPLPGSLGEELARLGVPMPDTGDPELRSQARTIAYDVLSKEAS